MITAMCIVSYCKLELVLNKQGQSNSLEFHIRQMQKLSEARLLVASWKSKWTMIDLWQLRIGFSYRYWIWHISRDMKPMGSSFPIGAISFRFVWFVSWSCKATSDSLCRKSYIWIMFETNIKAYLIWISIGSMLQLLKRLGMQCSHPTTPWSASSNSACSVPLIFQGY